MFRDATVRKAVLGMMAAKRFSLTPAAASQLADDLSEYKRAAEDVSTINYSSKLIRLPSFCLGNC